MEKKVIFVDCFNTIILRKKSPNDVLFSWSKKLNLIFSEINAITFYKLFKTTELEIARMKKQETDEREYTLSQILNSMFSKLVFYGKLSNVAKNDFIVKATSLYCQVEMENHYVNKKVIEMLEQYKEQGKKIYILSDFYCEVNIIKRFLINLSIDDIFSGIFVSCNFIKSKRNGTLYQEVLKLLNISANDAFMIGDNIWSDKIASERVGIKSRWIFKPYKPTSKELRSYRTKLIIPKEYQDLIRGTENDSLYSNYSFPLYVFTKRLVESLIKNNKKDVFFLAREGYFLKTLFDEFCKANNITSIKSHYLEVSRGSIQSAVLKPIQDEKFELLFNTAKWFGLMSVNTFLRSLNFSYEQINKICEEINVKNKKLYFYYKSSRVFEKVKESKTFLHYYEIMRKEQHYNFGEYLKSFGVDFENDGMTVVDVGWSGTMQNLLKKYFALNNQNVSLTGYYIGYFAKKFELNNQKIGLMYAKKLSGVWPQSKVFRYRMRDYEQVLRAPKNRVVSYSDGEEKVVYDELINEVQFHHDEVENLQKQIFDKFAKLCNLEKQNYSDFSSIAMREHYKMIAKSSYKDFCWLHKCHNAHYDCFGYVGYTLKFNLPRIKFFGLKLMDFGFLITFWLFVYVKRIVW